MFWFIQFKSSSCLIFYFTFISMIFYFILYEFNKQKVKYLVILTLFLFSNENTQRHSWSWIYSIRESLVSVWMNQCFDWIRKKYSIIHFNAVPYFKGYALRTSLSLSHLRNRSCNCCNFFFLLWNIMVAFLNWRQSPPTGVLM